MRAERDPPQAVCGSSVTLQHVLDACAIDARAYPAPYQVTLDECVRWYHASPDIYTMLLDGQSRRVIGYINAMPLEDGYFELLKRRRIDFLHIPEDMLRTYGKPGRYRLYVTSVALDPAYKSASALKALLDAFAARLLELASKGIFVSEMLADAVSDEGARLCGLLGMEKLGSAGGVDQYLLSMLPPKFPALPGNLRRLRQLYQEEYDA